MTLIPFRRDTAQSAGRLTDDQRRFILGTRSVADLVAPAAVEVSRDHLRLEYQFARALSVTNVPRTVGPGWLWPLVTFDDPLDISMHIHPLDSAQMVKLLTHRLVQHLSSRNLAARGGKAADSEREVAYRDIERLRDELQRGDEKLFSIGLYLLLRGASEADLNELTDRITLTLDSLLAQSQVAIIQQDRGFHSCLPEGTDRLLSYRNFDTTSVATSFLFSSSSLSMPDGVLYGFDRQGGPVIFDPFDLSLTNANAVVFATSGAGKSYFTKLSALRNLYAGVEFLIVDPEDEYRRLCEQVGGQYIRLASTSGQHLNPFDLPPADSYAEGDSEFEEGRDPLAEQVAALVALLEVMLAEPGRPLSAYERAVLDHALYVTYQKAGITAGAATGDRKVPLLRDFHAVLASTPDEEAPGLATRLRRYVDGSLAGLFAGPTNVQLDNPLVVFNVQALESELRPIAVHLIAGFVWNLVRRARKPRLLIIDEAWTLMQYPEGAAFLSSMARRARKYYLGLVTITQDVADFLGSEHGRTVLNNASLKLLMKQDAATIGPVAGAFRLSDEERLLLLGAEKGEGLFFVKGGHLLLKVVASPREHMYITTAPQELSGPTGQGAPGQAHQPEAA